MLRKVGVFVVFVLSSAGAASAQVAMLTQVSGNVRVSGKDGGREAVEESGPGQGDVLPGNRGRT